MGLENRVAVIAGATGGLGHVVTMQLAARGMNLALLGTDSKRLNMLANGLKLPPERYSTHMLNVEDRAAVFATADAVMGRFGRVDALFNFVGGWLGGKTVMELTTDELSGMLSQHLWTTFHLTQAFVPHLLVNKWGRVATISPPNSMLPQPKRAAYAAAKAAQEALMLGLAQELRGTGVTSNVIVIVAIDAKHEREMMPNERNVQWTTPEEIAGALLYLLTDEANVINGQRILLYGG